MNDNIKLFLKEKFYLDYDGRIKKITNPYDIYPEFKTLSKNTDYFQHMLNMYGPIYIFNLDVVDILYQNQDGNFFIIDSRHGYRWDINEFLDLLRVNKLGLTVENIISIYGSDEI